MARSISSSRCTTPFSSSAPTKLGRVPWRRQGGAGARRVALVPVGVPRVLQEGHHRGAAGGAQAHGPARARCKEEAEEGQKIGCSAPAKLVQLAASACRAAAVSLCLLTLMSRTEVPEVLKGQGT